MMPTPSLGVRLLKNLTSTPVLAAITAGIASIVVAYFTLRKPSDPPPPAPPSAPAGNTFNINVNPNISPTLQGGTQTNTQAQEGGRGGSGGRSGPIYNFKADVHANQDVKSGVVAAVASPLDGAVIDGGSAADAGVTRAR
jgi:hypothetical protein